MIVAHTQLFAARNANQIDSESAASVRYVVEGALRLEALIGGLREFWQLSESIEDHRTMVDCEEMLKKAKLNLEAAITESKAVITSAELPVILASEATLVQLFQNLLGNALKYRSADPPQISVSAAREGAEWIFSVRDNGIGVAPEHATQIFGMFKRLHGHGEYSGTGIGLAICQRIVQRDGGRIWVEPRPGPGAEFKFAIPC